jgi:Leucine-rich repeat (LRR) protein
MKIFLSRNGEVHGPYARQDVERFVEEKRVSSDDLACGVGQDQWVSLRELLGWLTLPDDLKGDDFEVPEPEELPDEDSDDEDDEEEVLDEGEDDQEEVLDEPFDDAGEEPEERPDPEDLLQLDVSETVEKLKKLVTSGEVEFALDLLRGLGDEKSEVCLGLLDGVGENHESGLESPEWIGWENARMAFLYAVFGMVYQDPRVDGLRKEITKVNLTYAELSQLPPEIFGLENMEELSLEGNKLKDLPTGLGSMSKLTMVNLSGNRLKKIPSDLAELKNLQELDLSGNKFKKKYGIWNDLKELVGLKQLNLGGNSIGPPPEDLSVLSSLETLNLSGVSLKNEKLAQMSKSLGTLPALSSLDLSSCKISEVPDEMLDLKGLKSIDLSNNKLEEVPTKLNRLSGLDSLILWGNPVVADGATEHHEEFPGFDEEEREWPDLDFSEWKEPEPMELKGRARELLNDFEEAFEHVSVAHLDEVIDAMIDLGEPELLVESVRGCSLDADGYLLTGSHFPFPEWIDSIFTSDSVEENPSEIWKGTPWSSYNDNRLGAAFPYYAMIRLMGHLPQAERVHPSLLIENVKRLYLVLPERMPSEIGRFSELEELVVARNGLVFLPGKIGDLQNLRVLSLNNNNLTELPPALANLKKLRHLGLSDNSIRELPDWIGGLTELRILDLVHNRIRKLPSAIGELVNLQFLGLRSNKLTALPPEIGKLESLMHLWLGDNAIEALPEELYQVDSLLAMGLVDNSCIPTDNKWLRGVNLSHRPDKINLMAMNADDPEDAKWILNNVLKWNGS